MPGPDGKELWQYIFKESPYTSWSFWDDHQGLLEGDAPHDPQHKVFVNKTGTVAGKAAAEFGTIVVKENIGNDNKLKALTVMYKVEGFNPKAGDWFWAKYSPKGKLAKSGKVKGCIGCHTSVAPLPHGVALHPHLVATLCGGTRCLAPFTCWCS